MKKILILASLLIGMVGNMKADDTVVPTILGQKTGTEWTMAVGLENATDYVAFQMDLQLPTGTSVDATKAITVTNRLKDGGTVTISGTSYSTNFVVDCNTLEGNVVRVIGYNLGNHKIAKSANLNDCILQIPLKSSSSVECSTLTTSVSNIQFVNAELESAPLAEVENAKPAAYGDVNYDGVYDIQDILGVIDLKSGNSNSTFNKYAADVNGDNLYDITDVLLLIDKKINNK